MSFSALQRAEIAEILPTWRRLCVSIMVSVLFNEPKLLKFPQRSNQSTFFHDVSVLFNEPKLLKYSAPDWGAINLLGVSVLFNEPKLLKYSAPDWGAINLLGVSVLFNEPKLLKSASLALEVFAYLRFSALQRAEIAEMRRLAR